MHKSKKSTTFAAEMKKIVKDSAKLLTANIIAQIVGLVVYPILTRLYSQGDFGLLSLFLSIAGVLVLLSTAEYQYAIVLPADDKKARAVSHVAAFILVMMTIVILLSIPFARPIANLFNAPDLAKWWWLMPVYVVLIGLWNILNYIYIRSAQFTRISGYQISQSILNAGSKVGFGYAGFLSGGLIVSSVIAPLVSVVASIALGWRKCLSAFVAPCMKDEYRLAAREYRNFPVFNLPRSLVNTIGLSLPIWLLTPTFGTEQVGLLSLALLTAFAPLNIIARACYQVFYQRVSELVQQRLSIRPLLLKFILYTIGLTLLALAVIYFFVPQLVTILFGAKWLETAEIIRRLYPSLVFVPICGTICFLSDVFSKQKIAMWMEIAYVVAVGLVLWLSIKTGIFLTAISAYAWIGFAYMTIQLIWFISLIYRYQKTL